jgi:hypothetical protein
MQDLQHIYASMLLANGVSIVELADYLGYADPGFTLRTYTRSVPSSQEAPDSPLMVCSRGLKPLTASRRPVLENRSNRLGHETRIPGHGARNGLPYPGLFPLVT